MQITRPAPAYDGNGMVYHNEPKTMSNGILLSLTAKNKPLSSIFKGATILPLERWVDVHLLSKLSVLHATSLRNLYVLPTLL